MFATADVSESDLELKELDDCVMLEKSDEQSRLRGSLYEFLKASWPYVEPSQPFTENWHLRVLCDLLQNIEKQGRHLKTTRYVINVPPGTLKSILVSVVFPAWVWARDPKKRFLTASYGSHLTVRDNLRVRDVVMSKWFQELFPLELVDDQNTKTRFNTKDGGWRIATSVGGVGTGEHPNYIIIDDPTTAQQAESDTERAEANSWFDRTMSSRGMAHGVVVLVVMQRLHKSDLSGHLLDRGNVEHVCFPMEYAPTRAKTEEDPGFTADPRDIRTEAGELLMPQLFTRAKVDALKKDLGAYGTAGQLQQQPSPEGGGLFQRGWFPIVDVLPKDFVRMARGWDTAATKGGGDWTVGVKFVEIKGGKFIVVDVVKGQLSPAEVDALMLQTARLDGKVCPQREEKEGGASGKAVIEARTKLLVGFDYKGVPISGDKATRAKPLRSQAEAGNVAILRGAWNNDYLSELSEFPTGDHDDQVDASSAAFNAILLEPKVSTWVSW